MQFIDNTHEFSEVYIVDKDSGRYIGARVSYHEVKGEFMYGLVAMIQPTLNTLITLNVKRPDTEFSSIFAEQSISIHKIHESTDFDILKNLLPHVENKISLTETELLKFIRKSIEYTSSLAILMASGNGFLDPEKAHDLINEAVINKIMNS